MYGLPDNFDPLQFLGRELELVSFSVNTVHLAFDPEASITIFGVFEVSPSEGIAVTRHALPLAESRLMALLGRKVVSAWKMGRGTLTLAFEGGGMLTCIEDAPQYEAYTIRINGHDVVV